MTDPFNITAALQQWFAHHTLDDDTVFSELVEHMRPRQLEKDETLLHAGNHCPHIFLIHSGLLRLFYTTADGKERNKAFHRELQLVGPVSAALSGSTSPFSIQALEPSTVISIDYNKLFAYSDHNHTACKFLLQLFAQGFVRNENREAMLLTCNAEQRYQWLLKHEADLLQRLPQFHIASYIGVDAVSLSRLKSKLKQ